MLTDDILYESAVFSLQRMVEDFRVEHFSTATYLNWDAHATIAELPEGDLIGLAGVGMAEDEPKKFELVAGVQVSTTNDPNLDRMTRIISRLFSRVKPESRVDIYVAQGGQVVKAGWMVTALPRGVTPVQRAEVRAVQAVEFRLLLDPAAASSLRRP